MIYYKYGPAALGAAFFFALGWYVKPVPAPVTITQTQVQHDVQVKVKTVDRIVTKTVTVKERKPDGTTKETRSVEVAKTADRSQAREVRSTKAVAEVRKDAASTWSLGLKWRPQLSQDAYKPVAAEGGYRVGGPVWVTGSWNWHDHTALVGARIEF